MNKNYFLGRMKNKEKKDKIFNVNVVLKKDAPYFENT